MKFLFFSVLYGCMEKQVISASRRTDLPRWYLQPTIDAFKRGFITLKNPFNAQQEYTIFLQPDKVSCIVWWSKDYSEWLKKKHELREYKHFFQFTLNGYSDPILQQLLERGVTTPFADRVKQLKDLADIYSPLAINWRFDPIVYWLQDGQLRDNTGDFETILKVASDVGITRCTIAFCDWTYKKAIKRANHRHPNLTFFRPEPDILKREAISMGKMAQQYGVKLYSCADHTYVDNHYVYPSSCIDADLLVELFGDEISHIKDPSQREMCGCTKSRDIGAYTQGCPHSCVYCYANATE